MAFAIQTADVCIGPDFATWAEAKSYKDGHQVEGDIVRVPELTDQFTSNPEPQDFTASWARSFARAA